MCTYQQHALSHSPLCLSLSALFFPPLPRARPVSNRILAAPVGSSRSWAFSARKRRRSLYLPHLLYCLLLVPASCDYILIPRVPPPSVPSPRSPLAPVRY
ncbi:hypothetical protein BC628DRAFT_1505282 [Trametes gibbosa]|nr:hypothetical protein BC628DRAFT_1505282 [Trametes gibbosa]